MSSPSVGEAVGLSSGLTGEGIYQSPVSGPEITKMILAPGYASQSLEEVQIAA